MRYSHKHVAIVALAICLACWLADSAAAQRNQGGFQNRRRVSQNPEFDSSPPSQSGVNTGQIIGGILQGLIEDSRPPRPPYPNGGGVSISPWPDEPDEQYYPEYVRPVAPPAPVVVKPKPNKVPPKPVTPKPNMFSPTVVVLTPAMQKDLADLAAANTNAQIATQMGMVDAQAPSAADLMAASPGMTQAEANVVIAMMKSGKDTAMATAILAKYPTAPVVQIDQARDAYKALIDARTKGLNGQLTATDLGNVATAMGPFVQGNAGAQAALNNSLSSLGTSASITQMVNSAVPGTPGVPGGANVLIGLMPALPPGTVVVLGPDMALVGPLNPNGLAGPMIATGSIAQSLGLPTEGVPAPSTVSKVVTSGTLLMNVSDAEVNYVVNGKQHSMPPAYSHPLSEGRDWSVEFDSGNGKGNIKYKLKPGTYVFKSDDGWELYKQTFSATIDNQGGSADFNYVLNNKHFTLAAGESKDHRESYPLIVRFDDASGKVKQRKLQKGTFVVGVNVADNTVDLLDPTKTPPEEILAAGGRVNLFGPAPQRPAVQAANLFGNQGTSPLRSDDAPWRATNLFEPSATTP